MKRIEPIAALISSGLLLLVCLPGFGNLKQDPGDGSIALCEFLRAKAMPTGLPNGAVVFTGPTGDGRRGSAGFLVNARQIVPGAKKGGTRFSFSFERAASGYGFQVIHPFKKGHVLVSVQPSVRIYGGGSWSKIGWGEPATSQKVELRKKSSELLPLEPGKQYEVVSELTPNGTYRLVIDDRILCEQRIEQTDRLVLETPKTKEEGGDGTWIHGGSGWDRTGFTGEDFKPKLKPGMAGLILGPMDGSGPTQNFRNVRLSGAR